MVRRGRSLVAGIVMVGLAIAAASPSAGAENDRHRLIDRIVAKADPKLMEVVVTKRDGDGRPTFQTITAPTVARAKEVIDGLLGKPGVRSVEMNQRVHALVNDPGYPDQWALKSSYLDFARIRTLTSNDTSRPYVAVVDSGVQGNHPDLVNSMASGYSYLTTCGLLGCSVKKGTTSAATDNDNNGHGTHVAGIIAAELNNSQGVVGLAQRVRIRSVKVLGSDGSGETDDVASGIVWAADHADVINLSLGSSEPSAAEEDAVDYALDKNRVVVAAAGNCDPTCSTPAYPAGYKGVLGVGAYGMDGARASFSSKGPQVDVIAPGENILSTYNNGGYAFADGTSMATPFVSAEAALAKQHCGWTGSKARSAIMKTAGHSSYRTSATGFGRIRPKELLRC